jgi:hypothetical protein
MSGLRVTSIRFQIAGNCWKDLECPQDCDPIPADSRDSDEQNHHIPHGFMSAYIYIYLYLYLSINLI